MRDTVESYIKKNQMIQEGDGIIAAVSGGADSVCLLHVLAKLREKYSLKLEAVHVHHGLRGEEADRDAEFTRALCGRLKVSCRILYARVKEYAKKHSLSEEEAGRILRYKLLEQEAESREQETGCPVKIAVAHHGDDSAETVLYNLFRGSGLQGMGGIRPVRGRIVRPLLCITREQILQYLDESGLEYCQDSTNQSWDYTRNRMRHRILPEIVKEINPKASRHILQAAEKIRQADEFLQASAAAWINGRISEESPKRIPKELLQEPEILQAYVLRRILADAAGSEKDLSSRHVDALLDLLRGSVGRRADLPGGIWAEREYTGLKIEKSTAPESVPPGHETGIPLEITVFPREKSQENQEFPKNQYTKWFDYDKINGMLSVRRRRTGDYITLAGGGRKSVKAYMIDEKIPAARRDSIFLLAEGSHVLWIIGYRISEYYKIGPQTTTILQAKLDGGENHGG